MKWSKEAEEAVGRVPFFVRKGVKKRVEEEASKEGAQAVTIRHVRTCQRRFLTRMEEEVRGYQVETCFGPTGCPNRAVAWDDLPRKLEEKLERRRLKDFLKEKVSGPLKMHHELRLSCSDCPNACSRPQIADIGLTGACRPEITGKECTECEACVEACKEKAVCMREGRPVIDREKCLDCGQCIWVCPTGTLEEGPTGYRVAVGGKLGRHPRLASPLPGIHGKEELLSLVDRCLDTYMENCIRGERLGEILERTGKETLRGEAEKPGGRSSR